MSGALEMRKGAFSVFPAKVGMMLEDAIAEGIELARQLGHRVGVMHNYDIVIVGPRSTLPVVLARYTAAQHARRGDGIILNGETS